MRFVVVRHLIPDRTGICNVDFEERRQPQYLEKNLTSWSKKENEQQPGHIGVMRVITPLRHPCSLEYEENKHLS